MIATNQKYPQFRHTNQGIDVHKGLVSIIIPTYNRADSVVEAIASARAQTYKWKQIIVVDDGSQDDTAQRLAGIEGIEYYYQANRGQGAARNYGLGFAKGEYIASLDSDDLWNEDFLEQSVRCLEALQLQFVFTNWQKIRDGKSFPSEWLQHRKWQAYQSKRHDDWWVLRPDQVRTLFLSNCPAPSSSLLIRRDAIVTGWGEHMQIADDWYLVLESAVHHPCKAAFTLTPRWKKRVDDINVYDGQPYIDNIRKLYLHDCLFFRKDFRLLLTMREKLRLRRRELQYSLYLGLYAIRHSQFAAFMRIPALIAGIRIIRTWASNKRT